MRILSNIDLPQRLETLAEQAQQAQTTAGLKRVYVSMLRLMVETTDATSGYLCAHDKDTARSRVEVEYISPNACVLEKQSDLGAVYDERRFISTYRWLRQVRIVPRQLHVRDLEPTDTERRELSAYGAQTILYLPIFDQDTALWGYAELWDTRRQHDFSAEDIREAQTILKYLTPTIHGIRFGS